MKINSIKHWDKFIYGLLYPGFIGSMIYELIDRQKGYLSGPKTITVLITVFYSVDYLHLYGDMHEVVKEEKRRLDYLLCDVLASVLFFAAFLAFKFDHYAYSLVIISVIPGTFLIYKRKNKQDRKFFFPYVIISCLTGLAFAINYLFKLDVLIFYNSLSFLRFFVLASLITYGFYGFYYYDKKSLAIDKQIFG